MTDCSQINHLLPRLPDGDLDPAETRLVETHLEACAACRREAATFAHLQELIAASSLPPPSLPTGAEVVAWIMEQEAAHARGIDSPRAWRSSPGGATPRNADWNGAGPLLLQAEW